MQYKVPLLQWTCRDETIDEASNNSPSMSPRSEYTRLAWLGGREPEQGTSHVGYLVHFRLLPVLPTLLPPAHRVCALGVTERVERRWQRTRSTS